jgi:putative PIG3 family NAD(P)H quinone oxidoreductase
MRAVEISSFGPPEVLRLVERRKPEPSDREILVRIRAAGVARADVLQRQGKYPPPPGTSDLPGLDVAGIVEAVGHSVTEWAVGDQVCAILSGGGYAEYCAVPAQQVLRMPTGWTFVEAASLPENLFTVYDNLVMRAGLAQKETILIHGGSSGIGTMAIMLATLFNATIIVTAGTDEKCDACLKLGAHHAINYKVKTDFARELQHITERRGADVILDMVGGTYLARNIASLATEGRMVIIATQGGHTAELDLAALMKKRARIMGSTMRVRTPAEKGKVARSLEQNIWPVLAAKTPIHPVIDSVYSLEEACSAHIRMESSRTFGKVLLQID